jgi:c(7)-type cytochrome triheme protein
MRILIPLLAGAFLIGGVVLTAQQPKAPAKIVFEAKNGNVTYDHAAHAKREKEKCDTCHPKLFAQSRAPLKFKPVHKTAETAKTSCGACHRVGGAAFATTGNCTNGKCHVKGGAKS